MSPPARMPVVVRSRARQGHRCLGEEVILRPLAARVALVVYCDRCDLDPDAGCDGAPRFRVGDRVEIPPRIPEDERPLRPDELRVVGGGAP